MIHFLFVLFWSEDHCVVFDDFKMFRFPVHVQTMTERSDYVLDVSRCFLYGPGRDVPMNS